MYTGGGRIAGGDVEWVQASFGSFMALFKRVGLQTNGTKTEAMVCTPVFMWGRKEEVAYRHRITGESPTHREQKQVWIKCGLCGIGLTRGSLSEPIL